jgi:hypothetical protein
MNRDGSPVKKLGIIDFQDGCHCVRWGSLGFVCVRLCVRSGSFAFGFACSGSFAFGFACSGLSLIYYFKD